MEILGERPAWSMTDSEKVSRLDATVAEMARLETYYLHLTADLDASGYAKETGAGDTARFLSTRYRIDPTKARRDVRLANGLGKYDTVAAALPDPAAPFPDPADPADPADPFPGYRPMHPAQAAAIISELDKVPTTVPPEHLQAAEQQLVNLARTFNPKELRDAADRMRHILDTDGPEPEEHRAYRRESLTLQSADKGVKFRGYLANENAETLRTLIHAGAKPHKTIDGEPDPRTRDKRQADALTTLLNTAAAVTHATNPAAPPTADDPAPTPATPSTANHPGANPGTPPTADDPAPTPATPSTANHPGANPGTPPTADDPAPTPATPSTANHPGANPGTPPTADDPAPTPATPSTANHPAGNARTTSTADDAAVNPRTTSTADSPATSPTRCDRAFTEPTGGNTAAADTAPTASTAPGHDRVGSTVPAARTTPTGAATPAGRSNGAATPAGRPTSADTQPAGGHIPGHGPKAHLTITIDYNALKTATTDAIGDLVFGDSLSAAAVRRIACDAQVIPVVLGSKSQPLDVGTTKRLVTAPMRLALNARDRGCVVCGAPPAMTEAHHLVHWIDGGDTSVDNLVLLCKRHHLDLHAGHWHIQIIDGVVQVTRPAWATPDPVPPGRYKPPTHHDTATTAPSPASSPAAGDPGAGDPARPHANHPRHDHSRTQATPPDLPMNATPAEIRQAIWGDDTPRIAPEPSPTASPPFDPWSDEVDAVPPTGRDLAVPHRSD